MPGDPGGPVVTTLVCFFHLHARPRVHWAPGIPHALDFSGRTLPAPLGRIAPRDRGCALEIAPKPPGFAKGRFPFARCKSTIWIRPQQCSSLLSNRLKYRQIRENDVRSKAIFALSLTLAAGLFQAAAPAMAQEKITVWWVKGFYKSEDDALLEAIKKFEAKTNIKVELSQYPVQDMIPKTVAALDSGTPPDVAYADSYDVQGAGEWALEGKLEDLTDILTPMKSAFAPNTLETASLYNDQTKKKAYYGFPLKQQTMHVNIWKDMLEQAGFKESDIPTKWSDYWSFWCDKVQPAIRKATGQRIYAVGQPMGVESTDSFQSFYTFMDAYNIKLVDDNGKLLVDDPKVREGLIGALKDYTDTYTRGCTPPSSDTWQHA